MKALYSFTAPFASGDIVRLGRLAVIHQQIRRNGADEVPGIDFADPLSCGEATMRIGERGIVLRCVPLPAKAPGARRADGAARWEVQVVLDPDVHDERPARFFPVEEVHLVAAVAKPISEVLGWGTAPGDPIAERAEIAGAA